MANIKAYFATQNLKLEVRVPPGLFAKSILLRLRNPTETPRAFAVLRRDVGDTQFAARSILYLDKRSCK